MKQPTVESRLVYTVAVATLLAGIGSLAYLAFVWFHLHIHLPVRDMFFQLPLLQRALEGGALSVPLGDWAALHNGAHRIAVSRLLMFLDYRFLGGNNHLIYATVWLSIATVVAVFVAAFRQSYPGRMAALLFFVGLVLLFLSSQSLLWVTIHPINNSWYLAIAASILALWMVARKQLPPTVPSLVLALLFALIAALSNFAGVFVWFLLPMLLLSRDVKYGLACILVSAVFLTLYLGGVTSANDPEVVNKALERALSASPEHADAILERLDPQSSPFEIALGEGVAMAQRTVAYLTAPMGITHSVVATVAVVFSLLVTAAAGIKLLLKAIKGNRQEAAWLEVSFAIVAICLGVALATQIGRGWVATSAESRFQLIVIVYWLGICGLVFGLASWLHENSLSRQRVQRYGLVLFMALCLIFPVMLSGQALEARVKSIRISEMAAQVSALEKLGITKHRMRYRLARKAARQYLIDFDTFTQHSEFAHKPERRDALNPGDISECPQLDIALRPTQWAGILQMKGTIDSYWSNLSRALVLEDGQGAVVGYLHPARRNAGKGAEPATALLTKRWKGYAQKPFDNAKPLYIRYHTTPFSRLNCQVFAATP